MYFDRQFISLIAQLRSFAQNDSIGEENQEHLVAVAQRIEGIWQCLKIRLARPQDDGEPIGDSIYSYAAGMRKPMEVYRLRINFIDALHEIVAGLEKLYTNRAGEIPRFGRLQQEALAAYLARVTPGYIRELDAMSKVATYPTQRKAWIVCVSDRIKMYEAAVGKDQLLKEMRDAFRKFKADLPSHDFLAHVGKGPVRQSFLEPLEIDTRVMN